MTSLRLQIRHEKAGAWSMTGLPLHRMIEFDELADGLEYAKRECGSAPAVIELFSDGIYVAVSQDEGWPHRLCRANKAGHAGALRRFAEHIGAWYCRSLRRASRVG